MHAVSDVDHDLRVAAHEHVRALSRDYDDLVPLPVLREGFLFEGERVSLGSFQKGIHRATRQRGDAALTLMTSAKSPYDDEIDDETGAIVYAYRAGSLTQADNRALDAAFEQQVPLIYFKGIEAGQYSIVQPVFVTDRDRDGRLVLLEPGTPSDLAGEGLVSSKPVRAVALKEVKVRLQQHRFRRDVMRAYRRRCAVCSLKRPELVHAAHILEFSQDEVLSEVSNGLALCAIHHLAYDRNLMGIDPSGVVHIAKALREDSDGPMLREGLQGFHGASILQPKRPADRPEPDRLALRFERFSLSA
ncbi:MAG: HNH endonuclease [Actinomycetota bacterium]|nr:HNH endonuclease [Actinomycetota bacterium]MDQ3647784.1 HNH endonuclease [Actinomycetota bacterium]